MSPMHTKLAIAARLVLAAAGLLAAPVEHEVSAAFASPIDSLDLGAFRRVIRELDARAAILMQSEHVTADSVTVTVESGAGEAASYPDADYAAAGATVAKTAKDALNWQILMKEELGTDWLRPDLFRLGASSMLGDIERPRLDLRASRLDRQRQSKGRATRERGGQEFVLHDRPRRRPLPAARKTQPGEPTPENSP